MYWKMPLYAAATACLAAGLCSCENNPATDPYAQQEAELQKVVTDYVDKTVIPTYRGLADASMELYNACLAMREAGTANLTTAMVQAADDAWIKARRYWELSEAWLYGAAADYNIDPHIDSWPLDQVAMEAMLADEQQMAQMDEDGVYVSNHLGYGLLGFHAVEYMIFETTADGKQTQPRSVGKYTTQELNYLAAVAGDLRNQCIRLEAAWAGSVSDAKQQILVDTELEPTMNYGESMKTAGQGGSLYRNYNEAVQELIVGAQDIADEVGGLKIGNPVGVGEEDDPNYIESPYALNSIVDFKDNIISIQNAYEGYQIGANGNEADAYIQPVEHSLSAYVSTLDPAVDASVKAAIQDAIDKIELMQEPFVSTARDPQFIDINKAAAEACNTVTDELNKVMELLTNL